MVQRFAESGAKVLTADRDADGLAETVRGLDPERYRHRWSPTSAPRTARMPSSPKPGARFGTLDVCVNNAAVAPHADLFTERVEVWDTIYGVNTRGTFLMTRAAAKAMIDAGKGGRIINFSSGVAHKGSAGRGGLRLQPGRHRELFAGGRDRAGSLRHSGNYGFVRA